MKSESKVEQNRRQRMRRFADASLHIVADEGLAALTMARLAEELDTVPSAVYRYFASKGALITAVQCDAIERLTASYGLIRAASEAAFVEAGLTDAELAVARLVLFGRWFCATADTHLEELRLLQMIMSERTHDLDPAGGFEVLPIAMVLLGQAAECLDDAEAHGVASPGQSLERVIVWAAALGGVLETDSLARYVPELLGDGRLARQTNLDLLRGWGVPDAALAQATEHVDRLAAQGTLAPAAD
ncbi:MAG: helix-turn-helix domain-containing protein [Acidimicrobiales bacterium]